MITRTLRFATLNTWKNEADYFARLDAMATGLRALSADVILLQEAFRIVDEPRESATAADTAQHLATTLGLAVVYAPARRKPRAWSGRDVSSEAGLAILARGGIDWHERLPLPSDERGGERIALLAEVEVRGARCLVACVHLSHLRDDHERRREQLATVLAHPRWTAAGGIIGGDFNCAVGSPALRAAAEHATLHVRNPFGRDGGPPTHPWPPRLGRASRAIDHLLVVECRRRSRFLAIRAGRAVDTPVSGVWPSDHAAVFVDVAVPASAAGTQAPDAPAGASALAEKGTP